MQIQEDEKNRCEWNSFLTQNNGSFLQSWEWGEFQKSLGRRIWRFKNDDFLALIIKYDLPFGRSYLYCPHSPVIEKSKIKNQKSKLLEESFKGIKELAKKERVIFLRVDPEWGIGDEDILKEFGFRKSFKEIQPKKTLILDLGQPEERLLAEMHQKTRYNIRVAERHGVKSQIANRKSQNFDQNFEIFWKLLGQTAKRDKFRPHSKEYYQKMLELPFAELFLAEYKNKTIAANIVVFFGKRVTYLHGASDFEHRSLMAPYLLQWQQILEAKKLGCSEYDFWGIDEKKWPGITRFKKGFGGKEIEYVGAWDFIFDKKLYQVYKSANFLTGILKRL